MAAIAVCVLAGLQVGPARAAAVMDYTSAASLSGPTPSTVSSPLTLTFSFPGLLIDIESIRISGSFVSSDPWGFREQFSFRSADGSVVGSSYYYVYNGPDQYLYNFTLDLFPGPSGSSSLTRDVTTDTTFGNTPAFQAYLLSELGSTGSASIRFQPEPRKIAPGNSTFAVQSASLTVRGVDPPANVPIPASGFLFISGAAALWLGSRSGKRKLISGSPWPWRRRQDRMPAIAD